MRKFRMYFGLIVALLGYVGACLAYSVDVTGELKDFLILAGVGISVLGYFIIPSAE